MPNAKNLLLCYHFTKHYFGVVKFHHRLVFAHNYGNFCYLREGEEENR